MQITRGSITIAQLTDEVFCAAIGSDIKDPETEILIGRLHVHYIDDMIAALKAYKEKLK